MELARFYLEYVNENCVAVSTIRKTEQMLKDKKLLHLSQSKRDLLNAESSATGNTSNG